MAFKWRPKWRVFALLFLMEVVCGNDMYTQYSPKSSHNDILPQVLLRTEQDNIAFRLEPSLDSIPVEPSRITRSINIDEIPLTDNEIDKEIVVHKHGYFIEPTVAIDYHLSGFGDKLEFTYPGEGLRAPRGRALPAETKVRPTAVHRDQRQNTEIHKIITGIVKLLNGNVNVQANTLNSRPMSSRINNRGPPRISEAAVPEYEAFVPAKTPPPYPFDRPPMEQMPARPFHRPLPNWQRRRPPNRRPNPGLPVYNPHGVRPIEITTEGMDAVVKTTEKMDVAEEVTGKMETTTGLVTAVVKKEDANVADVKYEENLTDKKGENLTDKKNEMNLTDKKDTHKKHAESPTDKNDENLTDKKHVESPTDKNDENLQTDKKDTYKRTEVNLTDKKDTYKKNEESPTDKNDENLTDKKDEKDEVSLTDKMETMNNDFNIIQPSITEVSIDATSSTDVISSTLSVTPNADVVIEKTPINTRPLATSQGVPYPYRPRPGIVLDDTDFKPHGTRHRDAPVITAPENLPGYGEIFDVTVSAIQGPGEKGSVHIEHINIHNDDIIVSPSGEQGFVSIDGKRTYLNLFDTSTSISPTRVQTQKQTQTVPPQAATQLGTGVAVPAVDVPVRRPHRPPTYRRPQPTVRIDTCIVGDDSTCDQAQNEKCRTEAGISSCQCRPGYARRVHRDPCRRVVSLLLELRVDRLYDRKVVWDLKLLDKDSEPYQQLSYESIRAIDSAFSMTPFSDDFVSGTVNSIHKGDDNHVFVNYTILMQETGETVRTAVGIDIQKHILGVIRRRSNNVGTSAIWVESPAGSVLPLKDVDECSSPDLNDCHKLAVCINTWGAFKCKCSETTLDPSASSTRSGRDCRECSSSHCNERGNCRYNNGQPYCSCSSGYYGSSCEVDGEVVGVAVGASLAAALVIALTLTALTAWSRKWSREQKALGMGSPVFNYMASNTVKTPPVGQPPYQVTLEERMRWAQIAEAMAQANHYAQPEPAQMATRPSSAMFGYPTLPPVPLPRLGLHGTINTMNSRINSSHNLYGYSNHMASESTSSDASSHVQDRADLLVPRPKSRARSVHNQNGLYYDVEYENAPEPIYGTKGIPLSTYTVSRGPPFYR